VKPTIEKIEKKPIIFKSEKVDQGDYKNFIYLISKLNIITSI